MREIAIVTSNQGKMQEFKAGLEPMGFKVVQLNVDCDEIQTDTLEEVVKSCVAQVELMGYNDFILDDSGLFLNNYNGFPGVYSNYAFQDHRLQGHPQAAGPRTGEERTFRVRDRQQHPGRGPSSSSKVRAPDGSISAKGARGVSALTRSSSRTVPTRASPRCPWKRRTRSHTGALP